MVGGFIIIIYGISINEVILSIVVLKRKYKSNITLKNFVTGFSFNIGL